MASKTNAETASQQTKKNHRFSQWLWTGNGVGATIIVRENGAPMLGLKARPIDSKDVELSFIHLDKLQLLMLEAMVKAALENVA